ncbi:MAG: peptidyl-prolyl cis-trans isomerase [Chloroflexota bacterium]|nr:peptidyl-prolyl cis-trans isomerase [Chloroflexota bacterium]
MTVRLRPTAGPRRRRGADSEDRFQFWVTIGFIVLIVAVGLVLVAAIGIGYYNSHFKPIANVGETSVTRDQWADRIRLEQFRLGFQERRLRSMINGGQIDPELGQTLLADIQAKQATQTVASQSANDLVDLLYKQRLAGEAGLTVSDADIQAQMTKEASTPEQRHVLAIVIEPVPAVEGADPTTEDKQKAYDNATKAVAALAAGTPFEQVAQQYNTGAAKDSGGDLGFLTSDDPTDTTWVDALFRLPVDGTTPLIKGEDEAYRIGRVTEIKPGAEDPSYRQDAVEAVGDGNYREQVRLEALAAKLSDKVVADALATTSDQVRLAEIFVAINGSDPSKDVQVHASHILYSPKDDPQNLASLAPEDPAWEAAKQQAQKAADDLRAIADAAQRQTRFQEVAKTESDDKTSGAAGGELGTFTREAMVEDFATPLFDNADLKPGDIVGPVKSQFGYHVILFQERIPAANDRLKVVRDALAASGADFAAIARDNSDGEQALQGGELGWRTAAQLPDDVAHAAFSAAVGATTAPVQLDEGFYIEKVEEKASRPPDGQQAATIAATAFDGWYTTKKADAVKAKLIVTDESIFSAG